MVEISDRELLKEFSNHGDEGAFRCLVERYSPMVLGICRRILRQEQDAEEACQATFIVLAKKAAAIRQPEKLGNWIYGVAWRIAKKRQSMRIRRGEIEQAYAKQSEGQAAFEVEKIWGQIRGFVDEEITKLPQKLKEVLLAHYFQNQSYQEIAERLQLTTDAVRGRLDRARNRLRASFANKKTFFSAPLLEIVLKERVRANVEPSKVALFAQTALSLLKGASGSMTSTAGAQMAKQAILTMNIRKGMVVGMGIFAFSGVAFGAYKLMAPQGKPPHPESVSPQADTHKKRDVVKRPKLREANYAKRLNFKKEERFVGRGNSGSHWQRRLERGKDSNRTFYMSAEARWEALQELGISLPKEKVDEIFSRMGSSTDMQTTLLKGWGEVNPQETLLWMERRGLFDGEGMAGKNKFVPLATQTLVSWAYQEPKEVLSFLRGSFFEEYPKTKKSLVQVVMIMADPFKKINAVTQLIDKEERIHELEKLAELWPRNKVERAVDWANRALQGRERQAFHASLLRQLSQEDAELAFKIVNDLQGSMYYQTAIQKVALGRDYGDPKEILHFIAPLSAGEEREKIIAEITKEWAARDEQGAIHWVNSLTNHADFDPALDQLLLFVFPHPTGQDPERGVNALFDEIIETFSVEEFDRMEKRAKPDMWENSLTTKQFFNAREALLWETVFVRSQSFKRKNHPVKIIQWLENNIRFTTEAHRVHAFKKVIQIWGKNYEKVVGDWIRRADLSERSKQLLLEQITRTEDK